MTKPDDKLSIFLLSRKLLSRRKGEGSANGENQAPPMDKHQWRRKFIEMETEDLTCEIAVLRNDKLSPEMYGLLLEVEARLKYLQYCGDQLSGHYNDIAAKLDVIPEMPYILSEIKRLRAADELLASIREHVKGVTPETGGVDTGWILRSIEELGAD